MKKYFRHLEAIRAKLGRGKRVLAVSLIALLLLPGTARAAGLTEHRQDTDVARRHSRSQPR